MIQKITTISFICLGFVKGFSQQEVKDSTNVKEIEEVILLAQKKKVFSDHTSYSFDQKVIKSARYAKDLVLSVPQLELDPITNNVKSIKGERLLILINGVESTSLQLQSVKPEMVVRVEHYEIAPTRWANRADSVVNVITKNPNTGYTGGFNVTNSPLTGFLNGSAYFNKTEVAKYYDRRYDIDDIKSLFEFSRIGASLKDIEEASYKIGLKCYSLKVSINELEEFEEPVILYWKQEHFVVFDRIIQKDRKKYFILFDPSYGKIKIEEEDFIDGWVGNNNGKGILLYIEPSENIIDKNNIKIKILLIPFSSFFVTFFYEIQSFI